MSYRLFLTAVVLLLLQSCSGRSAPAPVVLLNSQAVQESGGFISDTYKVQPGDTLFGIAWYTGNDYRDIAKYNSLSEPYRIYPGQELRISPPPTIVKIPSRSEPQTIQSADPTTTSIDKSLIDPPIPQGYGEGEKVVKRQNVTSVNKSSESVKITAQNSFPEKVKRWVWPATGKVVETFSKSESGNKGIDIAAAKGTSIHAAADGKVVYSGSALRGYGNLVIIKHTDTFLSAYAYNDTIIVKERDWVSAGQKIATMGDSGTNSVKLHFEVRYRGKSLDPLRYLPATRP
ncbi:peptidoglycan DD-metalloendopeptidase family protein [Alteromonas sp. 1_MG-2023]|uniref:peptidoglycan DD-metalloendopeptidase family protein n=1 Tax=Alteromonas sp. 1_MG-2023 TaxID=3062669 RepID=UPI0026E30CC3|nr:peptidoglycan DD-metalloendopeptidase family protein [Alteromonas sp. 1_MG-2023]MDO6565797.1 peptidoglycan DD-metalloendopeptidase family protein [Alteromonas sp. 1_MG-2023]